MTRGSSLLGMPEAAWGPEPRLPGIANITKRHRSAASATSARGDRLPGWPRGIRTSESVRELSDWNFVTTWPENRRKLGGGDPSRASCMIPNCSSGPYLGGPKHADRIVTIIRIRRGA